MKGHNSRFSKPGRRGFIKTGAAGAIGAGLVGCGKDDDGDEESDGDPTEDTGPGGALSITLWKHFVPSYDSWIDGLAAEWGANNGVTVTMNHVELDEVNPLLNTAIEAGDGSDIYEGHFPTAYLEGTVVDLADVAAQVEGLYGPQIEMVKQQNFNPNTGVYHSLCHGYYVFGGLYRKSLWEAVGLPDGPTTFAELQEGGSAIYADNSHVVGIGMAGELDSNHALRSVMWGHGASVQDASENIVLDSPETRAALEYMRSMIGTAMDLSIEDVTNWTSRDNNASLNEDRGSYIVNPISAYRTGQRNAPDIANDTFLLAPLSGPSGAAGKSGTVILTYVVPGYTETKGTVDLAKEFIMYLFEQAEGDVYNSELYNLPAFPGAAPIVAADGGFLDMDPFGSVPANKLAPLKDSVVWGANIGYPGPTNAAVAEVFDAHIIPTMFSSVAAGGVDIDTAISTAMGQITPIFQKWRDAGLVGGA